jgi:hypothetical protein
MTSQRKEFQMSEMSVLFKNDPNLGYYADLVCNVQGYGSGYCVGHHMTDCMILYAFQTLEQAQRAMKILVDREITTSTCSDCGKKIQG